MNALTKINQLMIKEQCSHIKAGCQEQRINQLESQLKAEVAKKDYYKNLWIREQSINKGVE